MLRPIRRGRESLTGPISTRTAETLATAAKRGNLNNGDQAADAVESMWDDLHKYHEEKVLLPLFWNKVYGA